MGLKDLRKLFERAIETGDMALVRTCLSTLHARWEYKSREYMRWHEEVAHLLFEDTVQQFIAHNGRYPFQEMEIDTKVKLCTRSKFWRGAGRVSRSSGKKKMVS